MSQSSNSPEPPPRHSSWRVWATVALLLAAVIALMLSGESEKEVKAPRPAGQEALDAAARAAEEQQRLQAK